MALNQEIDFSTTAGSNTDVAGVNIAEGMARSDVNNAIRAEMALRAAAITRAVAKAAGTYTPVKTDHNQFWRCTGAVTLNLTAAATLKSGWCLWVRANGGAVTIDPNGAELIDGAATLSLVDGSQALVLCDGTQFLTMFNTSVLNGSTGATTPGAGNFTSIGATTPGTGAFTSLTASGANVFSGQIFGLTLSNNAGDAVNDIDIAAGVARDSTDVWSMVLGSAITKRLDANWAVGTNQGGLDTGSIANTTYHMHLIRRPDTGVVDALFSTSATAPTMPANYTQKRRIGSIIRAGATILAFHQTGDLFKLDVAVLDRNSTSTLADSLFTLASIPAGIAVRPLLQISMQMGTAGSAITQLGDAAVSAVQFTIARTSNATEWSVATCDQIMSNTSQQVRLAVLNSSGTIAVNQLNTLGWVDTRGKDS